MLIAKLHGVILRRGDTIRDQEGHEHVFVGPGNVAHRGTVYIQHPSGEVEYHISMFPGVELEEVHGD